MLPNWLFGSYKQYKKDTNSIANWLAQTATARGYQGFDSKAETGNKPKASRLKGKARKEARNAAKISPESSPKHIIQIKDFILLSKYIAGIKNNPVQVPSDFVDTVNRVIRLRKRSSEHFQMQDDRGAHAYFVAVLEEVLDILKPLCPPKTQAGISSLDTSNKDSKSFVDNAFAGLSIEEPSEEFLNAPDVSPSASQPSYAYRADPVDEELIFFAMQCLFTDVHSVRCFVQKLWHAQKNGDVDLVTAAVTTDTAIDIVRRMEEEFNRDFPKYAKYEELFTIWFGVECLLRGEVPTYRERPTDPFNMNCYDAAEWIMAPVFIILKSFAAIVTPRHVPMYKPGHYGIYDPHSNWESKSDREKFNEDKIVLSERLPHFCAIVQYKHSNVLVEDELIRGIRIMVHSKQIPLWLVFATQCFLDIHHIFRERILSGFTELHLVAAEAKRTIKEHLAYHKVLTVAGWPQSNNRVIEQYLDVLDQWVLCVEESAQQLSQKDKILDPPVATWHLLQQHPLLCGLVVFKFRVAMQDFGLNLVNAFGSVLYSAHLYNAVLNESFCMHSWPDMEKVIRFHTPERMFVGGRPANADAYFKRFTLCMGWAASTYAANRRRHNLVESKTGPRGLYEVSTVVQLFRDRYCENSDSVDFTLEAVEKFLSQQILDEDMAAEMASSQIPVEKQNQSSSADHHADDPITSTASSTKSSIKIPNFSHRKKSPRAHFHKTHALSPLSLLNALELAITAELPEMTFDYFSFHRTCWSLLRRVQKELNPKLLQYFTDAYIERENQLPFVVGYIFMTGSQSAKTAETLGIMKAVKRVGGEVTSKLLQRAGEIVQDFLDNRERDERRFGPGYVFPGTQGDGNG